MEKSLLLLLTYLLSLAAILKVSDAVNFVVENRARSTPGGARFNREVGVDYARQSLESSTNFIWKVFQENSAGDRKNYQTVYLYVVQSIEGDGVAETTGNIIHLSAQYIASYHGNLLPEVIGIIFHENTHVWQWDGHGQAYWKLLEGIADYVRLKASYAPSNWVRPGGGSRWDEGYDVTARFLDYCNSLRSGFVAEMNKKLRSPGYSDIYFVQLLGKRPEQLFKEYKAKYGQ